MALNPNFDTMAGTQGFVMCWLGKNKTQDSPVFLDSWNKLIDNLRLISMSCFEFESPVFRYFADAHFPVVQFIFSHSSRPGCRVAASIRSTVRVVLKLGESGILSP